MRSKIWKLQRPLFASSGSYNEVMAYTKGRKNVAIIPLPDDVIEQVFGDESKVYVKGQVKKGNLVVDNYVDEQSW